MEQKLPEALTASQEMLAKVEVDIQLAEAQRRLRIARWANLDAKISWIIGECGFVPKNGYNEQQHYAFVRDDDVSAAVRHLLAVTNISMRFGLVRESIKYEATTTTQGKPTNVVTLELQMTLTNGDDPHDKVAEVYPGAAFDQADKVVYKAMTGAKKNGVKLMFNISTGDDPEGNGLVKPGAKTSKDDPDEALAEYERLQAQKQPRNVTPPSAEQKGRVAANTPPHLKPGATNGKLTPATDKEQPDARLTPVDHLKAAFKMSLVPSRDNIKLGDWVKKNGYPEVSDEKPLTETQIRGLIDQIQIRHDELASVVIPDDHADLQPFPAEGAKNRNKLIEILGTWSPEDQAKLAIKASKGKTNKIGAMMTDEAWVETALALTEGDTVPA
jgi:hypothetical protein